MANPQTATRDNADQAQPGPEQAEGPAQPEFSIDDAFSGPSASKPAAPTVEPPEGSEPSEEPARPEAEASKPDEQPQGPAEPTAVTESAEGEPGDGDRPSRRGQAEAERQREIDDAVKEALSARERAEAAERQLAEQQARQKQVVDAVIASAGSPEERAGLNAELIEQTRLMRREDLSWEEQDTARKRAGEIGARLDQMDGVRQQFEQIAEAADLAVRAAWATGLKQASEKPGADAAKLRARPEEVFEHVWEIGVAHGKSEGKKEREALQAENKGLRARLVGTAPEPEQGGRSAPVSRQPDRETIDPSRSAEANLEAAFR
jgi:hypothetical protein